MKAQYQVVKHAQMRQERPSALDDVAVAVLGANARNDEEEASALLSEAEAQQIARLRSRGETRIPTPRHLVTCAFVSFAHLTKRVKINCFDVH